MKTQRLYLLFGLLIVSVLSFSQTADPAIILGEAYYNSVSGKSTTLTGSYTYNDATPEGTSTYKWYRDIDGDGPEASEVIAGATGIRYKLTAADNNVTYKIYFEVTPVDNIGTIGTLDVSDPNTVKDADLLGIDNLDITVNTNETSGLVKEYLNFYIKVGKVYTVTNESTVKIYGDLTKEAGNSNKVTLNVWDSSHVTIYGQFIATDDMVINVSPNSTFTIISGLDARDGAVLSISGTLSVTGDVTVEDDATFTIASGGSFSIGGDLALGNDGNITIEGDMAISGDMVAGTNTTIIVDANDDGTGTLNISGDLTAGAGSDITGYGPVSVGGEATGIGDSGFGQLPIELTYFRAYNNDNKITLSWQTATEDNNDYFTIERALDGINYEAIATVHGAGNSIRVLNYSYTDNSPLTGTSYYRLKQTDYNGKFEIFNAVSVTYLNEEAIHFGPVPTTGVLNVTIDGSMGIASLKLINMLGAVVRNVGQLENQTSIDVSTLPKGVYILSIEGGNSRYVKQIMIK